ncbi:ferritin-like domain-containing protein [Paenibacillus silvisoli]|uniref:ferritin-like domain-containing protein n=1 Tax=Paenibacillus silvisoli TaxID=3110539 RepID=UPI0028061331|nr:ferritin-like domain-containing protein [Paenibacillus silvisoli]
MYYAPYYNAGWGFRQTGMPIPYTALQESIQIMHDAVAGESNMEAYYRNLIELAPSDTERTIIASIRDDERKHLQIYREIYKAFTGNEVQVTVPLTPLNEATSYEDALKKVLFHKWNMLQKAGSILAAMPTGYYQNLLAKIAVDNVAIVSKWSFLLSSLRR